MPYNTGSNPETKNDSIISSPQHSDSHFAQRFFANSNAERQLKYLNERITEVQSSLRLKRENCSPLRCNSAVKYEGHSDGQLLTPSRKIPDNNKFHSESCADAVTAADWSASGKLLQRIEQKLQETRSTINESEPTTSHVHTTLSPIALAEKEILSIREDNIATLSKEVAQLKATVVVLNAKLLDRELEYGSVNEKIEDVDSRTKSLEHELYNMNQMLQKLAELLDCYSSRLLALETTANGQQSTKDVVQRQNESLQYLQCTISELIENQRNLVPYLFESLQSLKKDFRNEVEKRIKLEAQLQAYALETGGTNLTK